MTFTLSNVHHIIHLFSDVIIRINRIFKKCASKQKDTNMNIHFLSCNVCNVVNRDNCPVGYWSKSGQRVYNRLTTERLCENHLPSPLIKISHFDNFLMTDNRQTTALTG